MKRLIGGLALGVSMLAASGLAHANTMTINGIMGSFETYVEDGIKMTNQTTGSNAYAYITFAGMLNLDNGKVMLSMADNSLFDLKWVSFDYNVVPVDFLFSNGNTYTKPPAGVPNNSDPDSVVDFASLGIADDLEWFTIYGRPRDVYASILSGIAMDPATGPAPVPEPGTLMLVGAGLVGLAIYDKRRKSAKELPAI